MPASKSGPRNSKAVKPKVLIASKVPTGQTPIRCKVLESAALESPPSLLTRTMHVERAHSMQEVVTDLMRPRMTDGASRDSVGDGLVVAER